MIMFVYSMYQIAHFRLYMTRARKRGATIRDVLLFILSSLSFRYKIQSLRVLLHTL